MKNQYNLKRNLILIFCVIKYLCADDKILHANELI